MSLKKSAIGQTHNFSPLKKTSNENELDPYSTLIVEDLLQGTNEWRNVQDIVRLTIKALTDVVKSQSEAIKELEKQMPSRASKNELNTGLSLKANISDVSRTISEVASSLDGKISFDDVQLILKEYTLKSDIQFQLNSKASIEEVKGLIDSKLYGGAETKSEMALLNGKIEDFQKEFIKKMASVCSQKELEQIKTQIDQKANLEEVNEALETKANKQSVSNALHRKANRADLDSLLARKADISDLQGIVSQLDSKLDTSKFDQLTLILENKSDKNDFNLLINNLNNKLDKQELENISQRITLQTRTECQNLIREEVVAVSDKLQQDVNKHISSLNQESNQHSHQQQQQQQFQFSQQQNQTEIKQQLNQVKNEIYQDMARIREDLQAQQHQLDEGFSEKSQKNNVILEKLTEEILKVNDQVRTLQEEKDSEQEQTSQILKTFTKTQKTDISKQYDKFSEELDALKKGLDELQAKKVDKKEYIDMKGKMATSIQQKVDLEEVQSALNACQSDISARITDLKEEVRQVTQKLEQDVATQLAKKVSIQEVSAALQQKADIQILENVNNNKVGINEFETLRQLVEKSFQELEERVTVKEFQTYITQSKNALDLLQKDILLKANIKDICTLLDTKAKIEDVNTALMEIHKELDIKATVQELEQFSADQAIINESLCTENIVGRWTWKTGTLKSGSQVPWETQVVNTLPDNFLWEQDKTSILTVAPGLYEVCYGFFAKKKPNIQLLVNGEPIISTISNEQQQQIPGNVKLKEHGKHSAGNITGVTQLDFIVLPARARLCVTYDGEPGAEGFFSLKRI